MRIFLVILAALIVAGGTGFYVMQGLNPAAPAAVAEAPVQRLREVYVPVTELAVGTIITPDRLGRMQLADSAITGQMIVADEAGAAFLTGSVARQVVPQGVPIARSAIVQPGDRGFLAAVLPRGKRAITIPVDEIAGLSGLALPGDRVDLILTYAMAGEGGSDGVRASETVLKGLRVLAFDQRLGGETQAPGKDGKAEAAPMAKTATLEVSPRQAEIITLAQTLGTLSLILNSVRDGDDDVAAAKPLSKTEPASVEALVPDFVRAAEAAPPRRQTLELDVTSTTKVQIVRGVQIHATPAPAAGPATE